MNTYLDSYAKIIREHNRIEVLEDMLCTIETLLEKKHHALEILPSCRHIKTLKLEISELNSLRMQAITKIDSVKTYSKSA
jgi:hypothetical protein